MIKAIGESGKCGIAHMAEGDRGENGRYRDDEQHGAGNLNVAFGLRAVQSTPILNSARLPLGGFMIGFREVSEDNFCENDITSVCANLAAYALERWRSDLRTDIIQQQLRHRSRNLSLSLKSLVAGAGRDLVGYDALLAAIEERIHSVMAVDSVMESPCDRSLDEIIAPIVAPYRRDHNISLVGPRVAVTRSAVLPLSLVFHEMTLNAAKYGSFSVPNARINVAWTVDDLPASDAEIIITWRESGCRLSRGPNSAGFGTELLKKTFYLLGASMRQQYSDDGFSVEIKMRASGSAAAPEIHAGAIGFADEALDTATDAPGPPAILDSPASLLASLTRREREVLEAVLTGLPNKQIATNLSISRRTVEVHRASIMKRTACTSLPDLVRLVLSVD